MYLEESIEIALVMQLIDVLDVGMFQNLLVMMSSFFFSFLKFNAFLRGGKRTEEGRPLSSQSPLLRI